MSDIDSKLDRQEQIWAGLYGPMQAKQLVEDARQRLGDLASDPTDDAADIDSLLRTMDAALHEDDDPDEAGTMRPI